MMTLRIYGLPNDFCLCNNHERVQAFKKFLDVIDVHHIHLMCTSLKGFLALLFAQHQQRGCKQPELSSA
ncbi:putative maspardin [Helianthus anomalus]